MTQLIFRDGSRAELVDRTADHVTYKRPDGVCVTLPIADVQAVVAGVLTTF
ncbi:hypothetical protein [Shinella granuli]|uniref:Uncharacterized protein n=1 Tax=Shinella granuli TaxID=323621 RepID=A0A4V2RJM8_SHIGR|nr:hypothetical protein [Shinella granuli]TCN48880.1 hypothetical protein EV665_101619 [Shinella granuli]